MQALYAVHIKDRNKYGLNVIDRNDELTILYEKANVQVRWRATCTLHYDLKYIRSNCDKSVITLSLE